MWHKRRAAHGSPHVLQPVWVTHVEEGGVGSGLEPRGGGGVALRRRGWRMRRGGWGGSRGRGLREKAKLLPSPWPHKGRSSHLEVENSHGRGRGGRASPLLSSYMSVFSCLF